ncbi:MULTISPECIES: DUF2492 family protein [Persicobacter]|uniref:DUF2492 domain-containing protein n=1 Tax=Persicobacter diffluens TaxID=981 RepID=A0AAN4VUE0_9BACT|nr:DUF2492 family protein [Persicobacter sp. CCB-QB2]GJM59494.1 hypothetical protein PEDI_00460 [Persicobacter diffluens]
MNNIKHIHEVIFLVEQNNGKWNASGLETAIAENWGADVQFMACSGVPFPKEEALEFLMGRNKVVLDDSGKVRLHPSMQICNGHENFQA